MEFFSLHKWTLMQIASVFLTIPTLGELPGSVGVLGLASFAFASWRQWKSEKRRQELHDAKMRLFEHHLKAGDFEKAEGVLG